MKATIAYGKRARRLSSAVTETQTGIRPEARSLGERLSAFNGAPVSREERAEALERFFSLPSGREKPGRFWKIDFDAIVPASAAIRADHGDFAVESADPAVLACDLATAAREHPQLLARAFGVTGLQQTKFGALARAFAGLGAFVYVAPDRACDDPIEIRYAAGPGQAIFPWTVVFAERGSRVTIVERLSGSGAFICGAAEIVTAQAAAVTYCAVQAADSRTRVIVNRAARPGRDARVAWNVAELGGELAAGEVTVGIDEPGAQAAVTALFLPTATQHVDLVSTVDHRAGDASSDTLVKSAAAQRGQARFLGNIRIAAHAQGSDARLRDDALLLSPTAHVDSVPALEIAANDVKAYHGATVGAIDAEQIFYMESRGIERSAAERMIALGFFEPAIERFSTSNLRDEIRAALARKLS